jgi:ABC-type phosphate transport system permease subunit
MTPELIAMFGGSVVGFIMKLIAAQQQNQAAQFEMMLKRQGVADKSADRAAARGGVWMRRFITVSVLLAIIAVPTVIAFTDIGVSIQSESKGFLGLFGGTKWETIGGYVILPEVRQTTLAIVGFYFGSSQVK